MVAGGGWRYPLAFAAGCLLAPWTPVLPEWPVLVLLALASGAGLAFGVTRAPACLLLGALWFAAAAQWQLGTEWPVERAGERLTVTGRVADLPQRLDQSERFLFRVDPESREQGAPKSILLRWFRPPERLEPGQRWRLEVELRPPTGRLNPGGFDYRRYLLGQRVGASGRVAGTTRLLSRSGMAGAIDRQRQRLADIMQAETIDLEAAALKRALGVADRSGMPENLSERLRQTGTAHLLAISGLHIGMVAGVAGLLASLLLAPLTLVWKGTDRRRLAVLVGLLAAVGYAALAGFTLPTQRALIMLTVAAMALLARRGIAPAQALLAALLGVLLFDPLAPLSTGFWLSFAAVAVLIWAFAWRPSGGGRWLSGLVRAQLIVMIGLLPLNVGLFGQLMPGALPANLIAIPLVGFLILPALLVDLFSMLAGLPATGAGALAEWGLSVLLDYLAWLQSMDWAYRPWFGGGAFELVLASIGAMWLLAPVGWPGRWLGVVLLLPLLWPPTERLRSGELEALFLDVGDGLAVLVTTADEALLYDTGPGDGEGGDLISRILPGALAARGRDGADRVVVSHERRGHAGGVGSLDEDWALDARRYGALPSGQACLRGQQWRSGAYRFRVLHPAEGLPDLGANSSCVLHIDGPGGALLLTGGIDADVEARLLLDDPDLNVDVLQLSDGGHEKGGSAPFLAAIDPAIAVASVPRFDRRERVHKALEDRLEAAGVKWTDTGRCGAIRVRLLPGRAPALASEAGGNRRFWHQRRDCP